MQRWWFGPLSILATLGFGLAVFDRLPERVAIHWDIQGKADGWMNPMLAVVFGPAVATALWLVLVLVPRIDPRRAAYASFRRAYWLIVNAMMGFLAVVQVVILGNALGWNLPVARLVGVAVGLLLAAIGMPLAKVQPNWFFGIRTPWTLSHPEVWLRTHRVGARVLTAAGLVGAVAAALLPVSVGLVVLIAVVMGASLSLIGYSYLLWRRIQPPARGTQGPVGREEPRVS